MKGKRKKGRGRREEEEERLGDEVRGKELEEK
jgi:hypothetical protein